MPDQFLAFLMEDLEKRGGGVYERYVARGQVGNGGRVEGNKRDCPQDGRAVDR